MEYSLRVAVAKVAQNRRFHQDFRPFLTPVMYNAIAIGTMPPSGILGKNRVTSTFSGNILSTGVIATFRRNPATQVGRRHAQLEVVVPQDGPQFAVLLGAQPSTANYTGGSLDRHFRSKFFYS